jgi:hypothetical protein
MTIAFFMLASSRFAARIILASVSNESEAVRVGEVLAAVLVACPTGGNTGHSIEKPGENTRACASPKPIFDSIKKQISS